MNHINDSQAAEMCNVVNKTAKSLQLTKNYITKHLIGNDPLEKFYRGKTQEEIFSAASAIDAVGSQYGLSLGAKYDADEWLVRIGKIESPICQEGDGFYLERTLYDEGEKYSEEVLSAVAQDIQAVIDKIYDLKQRVLEIAGKTGTLKFVNYQRTNKCWTKCVQWDNYIFHVHVPDSQTEILDAIFRDNMESHKFIPPRKFRSYYYGTINDAMAGLSQFIQQYYQN